MILTFGFFFRKDEERKKTDSDGDSGNKDVSSPSVCTSMSV